MKYEGDFFNTQLIRDLKKIIGTQNQNFRFIGGCVRDLLIKKQINDIDLATILLPEEIINFFSKKNVKVIPTGIKHGTISILINDKIIEITTLRMDRETDGRHAKVEYIKNWEQDASRRDFTINAMSMDFEGNIYDYFDGYNDLKNGIIKFIGNIQERIREDYLRIMRFFRFYAYYGLKDLDNETLNICKENAHNLMLLSKERIRDEIFKIFLSPNIYKTLKYMESYEILKYIYINNLNINKVNEIANYMNLYDPNFILAMLIKSENLDKFALSNKQKQEIRFLQQKNITSLKDYDPKKMIINYGKENCIKLIIYSSIINDLDKKEVNNYIKFANNWEEPFFPINGHDILSLGYSGKMIKEKLEYARKLWEDADYHISKEELTDRLKRK